MVRLPSYLLLVIINYVLLDNSKRNVKSVYKPYGLKMCKELFRDSPGGYIYDIENLSCRKKEKVPDRNASLAVKRSRMTVDKVTHGKACSKRSNCSNAKRSVCYRKICLCWLGFYFSPSENRCLRNCSEYGKKMDIYEGAGLIGYNTKIFKGIPVTDCIKKCVEEKQFVCLTFDFGQNQCYLSHVGYRDVAKAKRERGATGWRLAQRQCK